MINQKARVKFKGKLEEYVNIVVEAWLSKNIRNMFADKQMPDWTNWEGQGAVKEDARNRLLKNSKGENEKK